MRWLTAGESHGPALLGILDGMPSGVTLTTDMVRAALARRRLGHGRGARQKFERDEVTLSGGVRHGVTTGAPIGMTIANSEWPKWEVVMSADPVAPEDLLIDAGTGDEREIARNKRLTKPRPGHADLAGMLAYDHTDARNVLERASARETAMRVGLGACARAFLTQAAGIEIVSHVVAIGSVTSAAPCPRPADAEALDASPVRCLDEETQRQMIAAIDDARSSGDTIGGVAEVVAYGVPIGLGTHTQYDRRLDTRLAGALMSIPSVKAVEIGDGFAQSRTPGSRAHDEIVPGPDGLERTSNHAGGIEGGMSSGGPVRVRCAFKPISTVPHALATVDLDTGEAARALHQRSDACAVVPGAVVAEYQVALTLAAALLDHVGGYSLAQVSDNLEAYRARLGERS
ncbi:chorismate synthase [Nanchangia anserum]|uniref:Chorismate synthase n=1 Tax=Nanchangia anserum TaxID=2692125 RepID=A0A8I0KN10_9ACTO|nr:chorismate synthase [Nanchangia anserum]MBD3688776.1 chorismate synthase [Nanchangia anserum]